MNRKWDRDSVLAVVRGFMESSILGAAVKLDLFTAIGRKTVSAEALAGEMGVDPRALRTLLDAAAAIGMLRKSASAYTVPEDAFELLSRQGAHSIYHAAHHTAILSPRWADLAEVVRTGVPFTHREGHEAPPGALETFIEAMHHFASPEARGVVAKVGPLTGAKRFLDVGGGPGTYTIAFLQANPDLSGVLFDRPRVIPIARRHVEQAGLAGRVELVGGSFYKDELPAGADIAWVSAIIHMNSRRQNRELFAKVFRALSPGGRIFIRDHVMDGSRTDPPSGAMFAINMLVSTVGGGTFTFDEIREDLAAAGLIDAELLDRAEMNSLVAARKP